jgi:hypothetical protein
VNCLCGVGYDDGQGESWQDNGVALGALGAGMGNSDGGLHGCRTV